MANKLKNLKVTSVDLVPLGANPEADIKIFKNRDLEIDNKINAFWKRIQKAFSKTTGIEPSDEVMKQIESSVEVDNTVESITKTMNESLQSIQKDSILSTSEKIELIHKSLMECAEFIEKSSFYDENTGSKSNEKPKVKSSKQNNLNNEKSKEEDKMDIEKMSSEDKKLYEQLIKKYEKQKPTETVPETNKVDKADKTIAKETEQTQVKQTQLTQLNPEIKKALEEVEQLKKALEMQQLESVAKKYELLGKKSEELVPKLYELKKAGGTAYNDYIAILDEMSKVYQTSGIFKEIGSNNSGDNSVNGQLDAAITEIKKTCPNLSMAEAIVKACDSNPELKAMYETM